MTSPADKTTSVSWRDAIMVYWHRKVLVMLGLGFSAGLPFLLVFSTLSAWLREFDVSRTLIGYFSWVGITYSIKFMWAPVIERLHLGMLDRWLGHRRSWMLIAQIGIAAGLLLMTQLNPGDDSHLTLIALCALWVAFCSATQDITVDAFRIESAGEHRQGALAASYILGYRIALLMAGAGAFYLADWMNWSVAYGVMALCMMVGVITVFFSREPIPDESAQTLMAGLMEKRLDTLEAGIERKPWARFLLFSRRQRKLIAWFSVSVVGPIAEFFIRNRWHGLTILLFIGVYRLSDITMGVMANPFYLDMGFSLTDIASVTKVFGFFMTILGSVLGGVLVAKFGLLRPLMLGAILVALTNLLFAVLSQLHEPLIAGLAIVISADNISGGIANVVFIAYLSSLTNRSYTATQYALFSSLMTLPGKIIAGYSGVVVDAAGYFAFFIYAAGLGVPAILLISYLVVYRLKERKQLENASA